MLRTPHLLGWILLTCTAGSAVTVIAAQERDRAKIPDKIQVGPDPHLSNRRRVEGGEGEAGGVAAEDAGVQGCAGEQPGQARGRARARGRPPEDTGADVRIRQHDVRPGHPRQQVPGHAAGDGRSSARDLGAETAFMEPEILKMDTGRIDKFVAQEPRLKVFGLYLDDIQRRRPHTGTEAEESCSPRAPRCCATAPSDHLRHPVGRRLPLPDRHAQRRQERAARQLGVQRLPRRPEPRRPAEGDVGVLRRARHLPGDLRRDAEQRRSSADIFYAQARKYDSALQAALDAAEHPGRPSTCASSTA